MWGFMFKIIKKIWRLSWINTIRFNFHYLPFKQAIRLPFFLYSSKIFCLKGSVELLTDNVWPGMIKLGHLGVPLLNKQGFLFSNKGNIVFKGKAYLGNGSAIRCYPKASLHFSNNFAASQGLKIDCFSSIKFGENVRFGWDCIVMDSSQHRLKNEKGEFIGVDTKSIRLGKNTWIGSRSLILKGAVLPNFSIVAAMSCVNKDFSDVGEKVLLAPISKSLAVKKQGIWRDPCDLKDNISNEYWNLDEK